MQFSPVINLIVWINYSECFEFRISDHHILDSVDGFYCSHLCVLTARNATDLMQVVDFSGLMQVCHKGALSLGRSHLIQLHIYRRPASCCG